LARCVIAPQQSAGSTKWPQSPSFPPPGACCKASPSCSIARMQAGSRRSMSPVGTISWPISLFIPPKPRSCCVLIHRYLALNFALPLTQCSLCPTTSRGCLQSCHAGCNSTSLRHCMGRNCISNSGWDQTATLMVSAKNALRALSTHPKQNTFASHSYGQAPHLGSRYHNSLGPKDCWVNWLFTHKLDLND
jgi:hypothetical protein